MNREVVHCGLLGIEVRTKNTYMSELGLNLISHAHVVLYQQGDEGESGFGPAEYGPNEIEIVLVLDSGEGRQRLQNNYSALKVHAWKKNQKRGCGYGWKCGLERKRKRKRKQN